MKLAIAIIHGLGSEEQFFSVELKHRIVEKYILENPNHSEDDLVFQEIYWGDLVKDSLAQLSQRVNYKNNLTYPGLRRSFMDYLGVSHSYRNGVRNDLYLAIHERVRENLRKLASHRRVDDATTPLVVLAHSFGGVIMSDFIWDIRQQQKRSKGHLEGLSALEQMDTFTGFITFGNPMALFAAQNPDAYDKPIEVKGKAHTEDYQKRAKWFNFYDKDDIVAYPLKGLNAAYDNAVAGDFEINVGSAATSWNPACHMGYWEDPDFYIAVSKYLCELQAEHTFWKE